MFSIKRLVLSLISFLILAGFIQARVLNVPEDHETIQGGIRAANYGDTVLVQPGTYIENINFQGKAITIASLILTTGDEAYIDSTVIDGDEQDRVVNFENHEDNTSVLTGFTIRNGYTSQFSGAGIRLSNAHPTLSHLKVTDNHTESFGGGICCWSESTIYINHTIICNNTSAGSGGGIYFNGTLTVLTNVTISDNEAVYSGGGIYSLGESTPRLVLDSCTVTGNRSRFGGGISLYCGPTAVCTNVLISGNHAESGGGISVGGGSSIEMSHSLVADNIADEFGGGFRFLGSRTKNLQNVTIVNNQAESGGGIYSYENSINNLVNCIVWNNSESNIFGCDHCSFTISYSDIEGGRDEIVIEDQARLEWGEGNISSDPLFIEPDCDDFHLTEDSPCIDTGDPESPEDPDSSRADMGAFPFMQYALLYGVVLDAANNRPLQNATISTSRGESVRSDSSGRWNLSVRTGELELTASYPGYNDSTLAGLELDFREELEITFRLLHPDFLASDNELGYTLGQGDSTRINFFIHNDANGPLTWTVTAQGDGEDGLDPWELRRSHHVGQEVDDSRIHGVVFIDDRFYVTGGDNDTNYVYVLDRHGELIRQFPQFDETPYGMRDLAYDGELIWGSNRESVFGFNTDGRLERSWECRWNSPTTLAWDPDRNLLWVGSITSDIVGFDRIGNPVSELSRNGLYVYGMAYWSSDPDGFPLYLFSKERETNRQMLYKMNPDNGDTLFIRYLDPEEGGMPVGAFITDHYDHFGGWVFINVSNAPRNAGGDRIDIWQLQNNVFWMQIEPAGGTIRPGGSQELTLGLTTIDPIHQITLEPDLYEGSLIFTHNAAGGEAMIPVVLSVTPNDVREDNNANLPLNFGISSIFPNPFNASSTVTFTLPLAADIALKLYDLHGREAVVLAEGFFTAGRHCEFIDGENLSAGIYFVKLSVSDRTEMRKVVLVK